MTSIRTTIFDENATCIEASSEMFDGKLLKVPIACIHTKNIKYFYICKLPIHFFDAQSIIELMIIPPSKNEIFEKLCLRRRRFEKWVLTETL